MARQRRVYKFGGTSVGSADAVRSAVEIVREVAPGVVVVVSASSGSTDLLLDAGRAALEGDEPSWRDAASTFHARHQSLVRELVPSLEDASALEDEITRAAHELEAMCESISILRELSPRIEDAIVARGERLMAAIFAASLRDHGIGAEYVDATDVIATESRPGSRWPDIDACATMARPRLDALAERGIVAVVPGFIASGPDGEVVTLGRGGTDLSAAVVARCINAESLTLWKEVHGLMTADPRVVPDARVIPELHYREAAELAYYGAKVLHPRTMIPLVDGSVPLLIRNTFDPSFAGTRIAADVEPGGYPVKALTAIRGQALLAVEGNGMMGVPGIAARTFGALSSAGHSVSMISQASSESSICFVIPGDEAENCARLLDEAFEREIERRLIERTRVTTEITLLAIVGLGMRGTRGIAGRVFSALGRAQVNIIAIAQGSSELNITIAIDDANTALSLTALHREFQLSKLRPLTASPEREVSFALLGFGRIGRELARQVVAQATFLRNERGATLRCVGLADRSGLAMSENGWSADEIAGLIERKEAGRSLAGDEPASLDMLRRSMKSRLWSLPTRRAVLVDATAEETATLLLDAIDNDVHLVLANKKPLAIPQKEFDELIGRAREKRLQIRYEATVGAGLPILDTFAKLQDAGDTVLAVTGCLSGTLGFLMTQLEDGVAYSTAVRRAFEMGYTEPDPREDLGGMDVARKALILARTLGYSLDLDGLEVEPLYPESASDPDPETFLSNLEAYDAEIADRITSASKRGRVLRYIARIDGSDVRVGLEEVGRESPEGRLRGTDNQVVIRTRRYDANPLVVIGPGAGAEVTAAGVLNDLVAIAIHEERRGSSSIVGGKG